MRTRPGLMVRALRSRPISAAAARSASGLAMVEASTRLRPIESRHAEHEHPQHLLALAPDQAVDLALGRADGGDADGAAVLEDGRGDGEGGAALRRRRR